ncbi:MAG: hypothetical protein HY821_13100 [Acidobacteria bacterium]|nr:hypothetical protein [Acidobacteriota bacterium]
MTRRLLTLAALAATLCFAADKPNYSGLWKINAAKSDFGPMPQGPDKFERTIDHKDPAIKITTVQSMGGNERTVTVEYTINGQEQTVKTQMGEYKAIPAWKDNILEVSAKREMQGMEIKSVEKWTLSPDGKVLTVQTSLSTPQGDFAMKFVLDKQ